MEHSYEWINEILLAENRLNARSSLRLSQAVSTIMDGAAWSEMQYRLTEEVKRYE
jgi:hypothetical protein